MRLSRDSRASPSRTAPTRKTLSTSKKSLVRIQTAVFFCPQVRYARWTPVPCCSVPPHISSNESYRYVSWLFRMLHTSSLVPDSANSGSRASGFMGRWPLIEFGFIFPELAGSGSRSRTCSGGHWAIICFTGAFQNMEQLTSHRSDLHDFRSGASPHSWPARRCQSSGYPPRSDARSGDGAQP